MPSSSGAVRIFRTMLLILGSVSTERSERHNFATISLRETSCSPRPIRKTSSSPGFFSSLTREGRSNSTSAATGFTA
jgi:hypothetical protein